MLNISVRTYLISRFLFIIAQTRVFPRMSIMASTVITAVMARPVVMIEERQWYLPALMKRKRSDNNQNQWHTWQSPREPHHILTSSMIYYWTDARQHGILCTCWIETRVKTWKTKNSLGTRAAGECLHSFFKFSRTFATKKHRKHVSTSFRKHRGEKWKQLARAIISSTALASSVFSIELMKHDF